MQLLALSLSLYISLTLKFDLPHTRVSFSSEAKGKKQRGKLAQMYQRTAYSSSRALSLSLSLSLYSSVDSYILSLAAACRPDRRLLSLDSTLHAFIHYVVAANAALFLDYSALVGIGRALAELMSSELMRLIVSRGNCHEALIGNFGTDGASDFIKFWFVLNLKDSLCLRFIIPVML